MLDLYPYLSANQQTATFHLPSKNINGNSDCCHTTQNDNKVRVGGDCCHLVLIDLLQFTPNIQASMMNSYMFIKPYSCGFPICTSRKRIRKLHIPATTQAEIVSSTVAITILKRSFNRGL